MPHDSNSDVDTLAGYGVCSNVLEQRCDSLLDVIIEKLMKVSLNQMIVKYEYKKK